jgi:hypothetical protein
MAEKKYSFLNPEDIMIEGDEFFHLDHWFPVKTGLGKPAKYLIAYPKDQIRRPIK